MMIILIHSNLIFNAFRSYAAMSADAVNTRRRVKLYTLNEGRTWDDNGTGHVTVKMADSPKFMALVVNSETDGMELCVFFA